MDNAAQKLSWTTATKQQQTDEEMKRKKVLQQPSQNSDLNQTEMLDAGPLNVNSLKLSTFWKCKKMV